MPDSRDSDFLELHAASRNQVIERAARDKIHRDEVSAIGLQDFINRDDVGAPPG